MSNPLLLSSYGAPADFIIKGRPRGYHALRPLGAGTFRYECDVTFNGRLPRTRIASAALIMSEGAGVLADNTVTAMGEMNREMMKLPATEAAAYRGFTDNPPRVPHGLSRRIWAFSTGRGFVERLIAGRAHHVTQAHDAGLDLMIDVRDGGAGAMRIVLGPSASDTVIAERGAALALALSENLAEIIESGDVFPDTRGGLVSDDDDGEPTPERLAALTQAITERAHWLTAQADRVDDQLHVRLHLEEDGLALDAVLQATWRGANISAVDIALDAVVPDTEAGTLHMTPQRGLWGALHRPFEHQTGHAALDDAFLIKGDKAFSLKWSRRIADRLLFLAQHDLELTLENDKLLVVSKGVPFTASHLGAHLDALLYLWRAVCRERAGLQGDVDVYA